MSRLRFVRDGQLLAVVEAVAGDSLLDVARFHQLPLHWRCGQGTCGTCVVRIAHAAQPRMVQVGRKERNVLLRAGVIDAERAAAEQWPDDAATARLACHLWLDEHDWEVQLPA